MQPKLNFLEAFLPSPPPLDARHLSFLLNNGELCEQTIYSSCKASEHNVKYIEFFFSILSMFSSILGWIILFSGSENQELHTTFFNLQRWKCLRLKTTSSAWKTRKVYSEKQDWNWTKLGKSVGLRHTMMCSWIFLCSLKMKTSLWNIQLAFQPRTVCIKSSTKVLNSLFSVRFTCSHTTSKILIKSLVSLLAW